jgi:hypothetical protein
LARLEGFLFEPSARLEAFMFEPLARLEAFMFEPLARLEGSVENVRKERGSGRGEAGRARVAGSPRGG